LTSPGVIIILLPPLPRKIHRGIIRALLASLGVAPAALIFDTDADSNA
jgi:F420-0:gamma-glutamyl ligase-like protein